MTEVIDSTNLGYLRAPQHSAPMPELLPWPKREVATATLQQGGIFFFPLATLIVTSTSADWSKIQVGQLIEITDGGGNLVVTSCVRLPPSGSFLYISAMGRGDTGRSQAIAVDLADGMTITVYDMKPMWGFASRILGGSFLKFYDQVFTGQTNNPPPVVNIGKWRHAFSDPVTHTAQFVFDDNDSLCPSKAWHGKTITGHQWSVDGSTTFVPDAGSMTSNTITITLGEGFHIIEDVLTDSGGATAHGERPVWVTPMWGAGAPLSRLRAVVLSGQDHQDLQGRTVGMEVYARHDLLQTELYDGAPILHVEYGTHGGNVCDPGVIINQFVGYIDSTSGLGNLALTAATITVKSPMVRLAGVGNPTQAIIEADSPADWTQIPTGLGDPNFAAFYVLKYGCPNALDLFDFHFLPEAAPPRKHSYGLNTKTFNAQLGEIAAMILGNCGSASDGAFYFFRNPNIENSDFRNALETRIEIGAGDLTGDIVYPKNYPPPVSAVTLGMFTINTGDDAVDAFEAIAPSISAGQGGNVQGGQTIIGNDSLELLDKVGNFWSLLNNPTLQFQAPLNRNLDVFDPARHYNTWVQLSIPASYDPYGVGYSTRALVVAVDRSWEKHDPAPANKKLTVTFQPETQGKPGQLLPNDGTDNVPAEILVNADPLYANLVFACDDQGGFGATSSFLNTPLWKSIKGKITGTVTDWDFDYNSSLLKSGLRYGTLGMWAVSVNGTTVKIWYSPSVLAGVPIWTVQATYAMADSSTATQLHLVANKRVAGDAWVAWRDQIHTRVCHTSDGVTWSTTPIALGSMTVADTGNDDAPFGLTIEGDYVIVAGYNFGAQYVMFKALTSTASFTQVGSFLSGEHPVAVIAPGDPGSVYMSYDRDPALTSLVYAYGEAFTPTGNMPSQPGYTASPSGFAAWTFGCDGGTMQTFGVYSSDPPTTYDCLYDALFALDPYDDWECTQIAFQFGLQTWNLAISTTQFMTWTVELLDASMGVLYTHSDTFNHTRANSNVSECGTQTTTLTGLSVSGVKYVHFTAEIPTAVKTASNQIIWGALNGFAATVQRTQDFRNFFHVIDYKDSHFPLPPPDYQVIPEDTDWIPRTAYSVALDGPSTRLSYLISDGATTKLFASNKSGSPQTLIASGVPWSSLRRSGNRLILWGDSVLDFSNTLGQFTTSRIGNWASAIGTIGKWLKVGGIT